MSTTVSAREANQHFSQILRRVQAGEHIVVTSRGRPVAEVSGVTDAPDERWEARKADFVSRLRERAANPLPVWSRDELYD